MEKKDSLGRKIPIRTDDWKKNISRSLKKGEYRKCFCGKSFYVYRYRLKEAKYCSRKCSGKYAIHGLTKGMKIPKGSEVKMGDKNPMRIHGIKPEHLAKLQEGAKRYQDSIRVSPEHKRMVKKIHNHKRKASMKGTFTHGQWLRIKQVYGNKCAKCKKGEPWVELTIDHILPLSKEGTNGIENIQPLCRLCNIKKGNRENIKYEKI